MVNEKMIRELQNGLSNNIFASRDTVKGGYDYFQSVLETLPKENQGLVLTGCHVLLNSISDYLGRAVSDAAN